VEYSSYELRARGARWGGWSWGGKSSREARETPSTENGGTALRKLLGGQRVSGMELKREL